VRFRGCRNHDFLDAAHVVTAAWRARFPRRSAALRGRGEICGAAEKTLRDASSRATKAFYPALSMCDVIFSGVFGRRPRLTLAIVEFELAWAPHLLSMMDYTYRERHGEAIYRFKACPRERGERPAAKPLLPPQRRAELPGRRRRRA